MKYNDLKLTSHKPTTRKGRGISAGEGKTAGRGTKGQGARKSGGVRPGFEGGQMPLYMRIPKLRGFTSHRPKVFSVYTEQLNAISKSIVDTAALVEAKIIEHPYSKVKLIDKGEVKKKFSVKLQAASKGAILKLEKAGGSFEKVEQVKRPAKSSKKD